MFPLNKSEIRRKSLNFWLLFLVLILFTIIPAYFFVWTMNDQLKVSVAKEQEYRNMYNKQMVLKDKIDSLYTQLNYVNAQKVGNYLYLEDIISQNKIEIQKIIGNDSSGRFATYSHILNSLNASLFLKDSIVRTEASENMLRNDLLACIGKNKKIRQSIFEKTKIADK